jgi:type II secretory pathway pseudopilin PulG
LQRASRNFFAYPFAFFTFGVPGGGGSNILIMVAIVALLAAIAVPSFMKAREQAQRTACRTNLSLIQDAKAQLATDGNHTADAELSMEEVALILNGRTLSCTAGGTYTANTAEQRPLCSVHGDGTQRISPNLKGHSTEELGD